MKGDLLTDIQTYYKATVIFFGFHPEHRNMEKTSLPLWQENLQNMYKIIIDFQLPGEPRLQGDLFAPTLKNDRSPNSCLRRLEGQYCRTNGKEEFAIYKLLKAVCGQVRV